MFDNADNGDSNRALREGLIDLPTPKISMDFDSRIQSALRMQPAWWQILWASLRPALPAAAVTMCGMFLLLHLIQQPVGMQAVASLTSANAVMKPQVALTVKPLKKQMDDAPDSGDSAYASLSFFSRPRHHITDNNG